jgi:hypothetical protein
MSFKEKYLKYKERYLNLKNQQGGIHSCPFRINQVVRIIGPAGSPNFNLFGKIYGIKFN